MIVEWNRSTWYSKIAAIVVFTGFIPATAFMIGKEFQDTQTVLAQARDAAESVASEAVSIDRYKMVKEIESSSKCKANSPACVSPTIPSCNKGVWSCQIPEKNTGD